MTVNDIRQHLENEKRYHRSAWTRGVMIYASELLDDLQESVEGGYFAPEDLANLTKLDEALLCGAPGWDEYSWGGNALIYNGDIAERLCSPSELKKTRNGERRPNSREEWLDTQARALRQAATHILYAARAIAREEAQA